MADYESNIIKPVDSLQNIVGLAPARRREQRRRRQQLDSDNEKNEQKNENQNIRKDLSQGNMNLDDEAGGSKIDYCA